MHSRGYRGSRESLHSGMTYSARRGSNASMYEGELIIILRVITNNYTSLRFFFNHKIVPLSAVITSCL